MEGRRDEGGVGGEGILTKREKNAISVQWAPGQG